MYQLSTGLSIAETSAPSASQPPPRRAALDSVVSVHSPFMLLRPLHVVSLHPVMCLRAPRSPHPRWKRRKGHQNAGCRPLLGLGDPAHRIAKPSWTSSAGRMQTRSQGGLRFSLGSVDGTNGGREAWGPAETITCSLRFPKKDCLWYLASPLTGQPRVPLHCSGTQRQPGQPLVVLRTCFWSGAGP